MEIPAELRSLPPALVDALSAQGFESLTSVQKAVLAQEAHGRDLRISSQTGSGKTVALGLVLCRELLERPAGAQGPSALVLAPTRELASQVCQELTWLLCPQGFGLCAVTGGTAFGPEARALRKRPDVVVATPGRLRDHLQRGTLDAASIRSIVLDEADQMLDFGFRDELEAILDFLPAGRRSHLVSATFAAEVRKLAERYQDQPLFVQGTAPGAVNQDIEHLVHVVPHHHRLDALINVLLCDPQERSLVFARTRADVAEIAERLQEAGFAAASMSGELAQAERTRRLNAFRTGNVPILVATDVAARGIDVPDVSRVVHLHLTSDLDAYTHRSGRTGRAGRSGRSIVVTTPRDRRLVERLFQQLGIRPRVTAVPGVAEVQQASEARLVSGLEQAEEPSEPMRLLAKRLLDEQEPEALVARLLGRSRAEAPCEPREIPEVRTPDVRAARERNTTPRPSLGPVKVLQIDWGAKEGADARRLVAMICRRTGLSSRQIGAIEVGPRSSRLEVSRDQAQQAMTRLQQPDGRDRSVRVRIAPGPLQRKPRTRGPGRAAGPRRTPSVHARH